MPPKAATAAGEAGSLNAGEIKFIKVMFDNMTTKPDADWEKMAEALGLANSKCAKERFRQMSKKHNWGVGEGDASPAKPAGKTAAASSPHKPTKVAKSTPKKKTAVKKKNSRVETPEPEEPVLGSDTEEKFLTVLNSDGDSDFEA
ncbi:hypothetical protein ACHAQH_006486 [Verticillium albo-atrum]